MILTAATTNGPLATVERHVRGNLARGADHVVVFLDEPLPGAAERLASAHVTLIDCDDEWWRGRRPAAAKQRALLNANAATVLGRSFDWVFRLDDGEVLDVDHAVLAALPVKTKAVSLEPLQAVSRLHWDGDPTAYKRLLPEEDLAALHVLRLIKKPTNKTYFHGAARGRVGIRPTSALGVAGHQAVRPTGKRIVPATHEGLRVLRVDGASGEEFIAAVRAGTAARSGQKRLAAALRALDRLDIDERTRDEVALQIFTRLRLDPEEDLARLGLLEQVHLDAPTHTPRRLSRGDARAMARLLAEVRGADKRRYLPTRVGEVRRARTPEPGSLLRRAARRLR